MRHVDIRQRMGTGCVFFLCATTVFKPSSACAKTYVTSTNKVIRVVVGVLRSVAWEALWKLYLLFLIYLIAENEEFQTFFFQS